MKLFSRRTTASRDELPSRRQHSDNATDSSDVRSRPMFRRNKTITGSSSRHVTSSNELQAELRSPRAQAHHLRRKRRSLGMIFFVIILICLALIVLANQLIATYTTQISGRASTSAERRTAYEVRIDEYFSTRPLQRLHWALDAGSLQSFVAASYPEVETIAMTTTGISGETAVDISLRRPVARWVSADGSVEYVDDNGIVFQFNGYTQPSITIRDANKLGKLKGNIVTSDRFLGFVGRAAGAARHEGFTMTAAKIPVQKSREIEIKLKGVSYRIKLSLDRTTGQQLEDAGRIIRYLKRKGIQPNYVDVRVEGKAFYR